MADVRTLMAEAERLTVLWEERWHSLLTDLDLDVARRCVTLRAEAQRVAGAAGKARGAPGPHRTAGLAGLLAVAGIEGMQKPAGPRDSDDTDARGASGATANGEKSRRNEGGAKGATQGPHVAQAMGPPTSSRTKAPKPGSAGKAAGGRGPGRGPAAVAPAWGGSGVRTVEGAHGGGLPPPGAVVAGGGGEAGGGGVGAGARGSGGSVAAGAEALVAVLAPRYRALMSPVVVALERAVRACSACEPETPAERRFAAQVLPQLASAVAAFKRPPPSALAQLATNPQACWAPLKQQLLHLTQLLANHTLELEQLSPALAALRHTQVPMPGLQAAQGLPPLACQAAGETKEGGVQLQGHHTSGVTIASVSPRLTVLPTKTRPKRLELVGSDGLSRVFLLKGRDDLRCDERLMQVLRVSNALLRAERSTALLGLGCRHYGVTPLGDRVGIIQWVDHSVSLFSLFKSWQRSMRERHAAVAAARQEALGGAAAGPGDIAGGGGAAPHSQAMASHSHTRSGSAAASAGGGGPGQLAAPPAMVTVARPVELFYARLQPALLALGLSVMTPRKQWPLEALRKVHASLARDAPAELLTRQLWLGCGSTARWWQRQRAFTASLAASSCMGYLLGLGDRHLDNILLDTESGQLVHIDFNVCFEKGLGLRVPEVVPFRLTQALSSGLGAAGGAEGGAFRGLCEALLAALRARREPFTALLDAVLGDPSVAWGSGAGEDAAARRDLELAVALQLFAARFDERREVLSQALQEVLGLLEGPGALLMAYVDAHSFMAAVGAAGRAAQAQAVKAQAALQEAEVRGAAAQQWLVASASTCLRLDQELAATLQEAGQQAGLWMAWAQRHCQLVEGLRRWPVSCRPWTPRGRTCSAAATPCWALPSPPCAPTPLPCTCWCHRTMASSRRIAAGPAPGSRWLGHTAGRSGSRDTALGQYPPSLPAAPPQPPPSPPTAYPALSSARPWAWTGSQAPRSAALRRWVRCCCCWSGSTRLSAASQRPPTPRAVPQARSAGSRVAGSRRLKSSWRWWRAEWLPAVWGRWGGCWCAAWRMQSRQGQAQRRARAACKARVRGSVRVRGRVRKLRDGRRVRGNVVKALPPPPVPPLAPLPLPTTTPCQQQPWLQVYRRCGCSAALAWPWLLTPSRT
ncbi:hypothetical protein V8C86DRAFT_1010253 [Haematococcus lacustris]